MNQSGKNDVSSPKMEDRHLSEESPEVDVGESKYLSKLFNALPALKVRNYRLYFSGQLLSQIGTWLQVVAQGWLVLQLTNSVFLVGLITAISSLPVLLFSLPAGVIVDRFPKKKIIILTQICAMVLAFILGILTVTKHITVWQIGLLGFLLGLVNTIDSPARNSFVVEMVGKKHLASAIALNSGIFNGARVIGPAVAGLLIATVGTGGAFILNGLSYFAVIGALLAMHVSPFVNSHQLHPLLAIKEGLSFSFFHPIIKILLFFLAISSIFGWSYTTILPVIARDTLHLGVDGLGYLYVFIGLGALVGVVAVSTNFHRIPPAVFILGGNLVFVFSLLLFSFVTNSAIAGVLLFFAGLGIVSQFATMNTAIQNMVPNEIRGRVMSIYTLMFSGIFPIGSFQIGWLSDRIGTGPAIRIGAVIVFAYGILIYFFRKKIDAAYSRYQEKNPNIPHEKFF